MVTTAGPSRQVQDPSYYVGVLQKKNSELSEEIHKLEEEVKKHEKDKAEFGGVQRKHENLLNEVRGLEGELADYNLAMDKARVGTDPADLEDYVSEFREKNRELAEEVDRIFVMKKKQDDETRQIEDEINKLHEDNQRKIQTLEPRKLELYTRLLESSRELVQKQDSLTRELDGYNAQLRDMDDSEKVNLAEEYARVQAKVDRLKKEERDLREELGIWAHTEDRDEALRKLKKRVEVQSRDLKDTDTKVKNLKEAISQAKKQIVELDDELAERRKSQNDAQSEQEKYEKLRQRDEEMTAFIRDFDSVKKACLQDQQKTQTTIVALLEHISQGLDQEQTMPSQQEFESMQQERDFKTRQYESAQETTKRLAKEQQQRETELARIAHLDEKIALELNALRTKMEHMKRDMIEFEDVDGLRQRAAHTMSHLSRLLKDYQARKDSVKANVAQLSTKYESIKSKLGASESHKTLAALEAKLRTYAQTIFHLQEYIETKSRLTDYKPIKDNCNQLVDVLNVQAKKTAIEA